MQSRQILFTGPAVAELTQKTLPSPEADQVLVEMEYTAVSAGTERDNLLGRPNTASRFPAALGYSGAGYVIALGNTVKGVSIGDRVLVIWGHHASHCVVRENQLVRIDNDRIDSLEAAFVFIASFPLAGLRKTRLEIGESVLVMGLGILGVFAVQLARLAGGVPVIAADLREDRRKTALELGADYAFSPESPEFPARVKEASGGKGVASAIEVTGISAAMKQALECCAPMARLALLGCTRVSDCSIDYYQLVHRPGISLIGAHTNARPVEESYPHHWTHQDDCKALLRMLGTGRFRIKPVISEVRKPEDAPEVYKRLAEDPRFPLGVAFEWK
jgi:2-desacetyl-2-hydroxyethyl bacteriochlorophyllide A dehydrogenase